MLIYITVFNGFGIFRDASEHRIAHLILSRAANPVAYNIMYTVLYYSILYCTEG